MPNVSLYIPAYNVEVHIERCIRAALAQTHPFDEILVIDDGSTDRTREIVNEIAASESTVRLVAHERNSGLGVGRNTGINSARNELVASLDADTCPEPVWLATLLSNFEDDDKLASAGGMLVESAIFGVADRFRRAYMFQHWGNALRRNPPYMFGSNTVVRRSVIQELGGFDPSMRTNGEDVDMSNRLREAGYDLLYDPQAVVHHHRTDTVKSIFDTQWRWFAFATRMNVLPPRVHRTLSHVSYFFVHSAWRAVRHARCWIDLPVMALNAALPFYMSYRQIQHDFRHVEPTPSTDNAEVLETSEV